ncbi:hypothetical protein ACSBYH_002428, partial [Vibrio parahaemolyticus]
LAELAEISCHHIHELSRKIDALSSKGFIQFEEKGNACRPIALFTDFEVLLGKELEITLQGRLSCMIPTTRCCGACRLGSTALCCADSNGDCS